MKIYWINLGCQIIKNYVNYYQIIEQQVTMIISLQFTHKNMFTQKNMLALATYRPRQSCDVYRIIRQLRTSIIILN